MGRKAIPNAEQKILREVINLSQSHTIRKISTIDIAYRMKVSETVIFNRFPTKESLVLRAFAYAFEQLGDIDYPTLFGNDALEETKLVEFSKATDYMSSHIKESKFIIDYMLSDYFNFSDLNSINGFEINSIKNGYQGLSDKDFQIFIRNKVISTFAYSLIKGKGLKSDSFAQSLTAEIKQ